MTRDPVDNDELMHDINTSARRAELDRLEAEFWRDPDWDLVAEHLRKRDTLGDLCSLISSSLVPFLGPDNGYEKFVRARRMVHLAIAECAREHAEREVGK